MESLHRSTASTLLPALARGEISAEALMRACLDRVSERDEIIRAWAYLDPEHALAQAKDADRRLAAGEAPGPLHGIPVGIKDIIDTGDMPTEHGSALFPGNRPDRDAVAVAALRAAGAIIMGKTVTTELANANPSKTRNPHDPEHTPGGSSAGSGAGVADGQVPLALGTETGGSVIRPASFNGVYGLKPTLGWIPRAGVLMQSHTLDTVGVYGRSLDDLALLADCLSIPEPADPQSFFASRARVQEALLQPPMSEARLAFLQTPAWPEAHPGAREAISRVAGELGSACRTETLPAPFDDILDLHGAIFAAENAHYYGPLFEEQPHKLSPILQGRMAKAMSLPAREYVNALVQREVIYRDLVALLSRYDAVLCLSAAGPAPRGFETTGTPVFNSPWTYLGVPCVSLPRLTVEGLPLGLQLVGARGTEAHLMRVAKWFDAWLEARVG